MVKSKEVKDHLINKSKRCSCSRGKESCFEENKCIKCSAKYAKYTLDSKSREISDFRCINHNKLKKTDSSVHSDCFSCDQFKASGGRMHLDWCLKYSDYCDSATVYCEKIIILTEEYYSEKDKGF